MMKLQRLVQYLSETLTDMFHGRAFDDIAHIHSQIIEATNNIVEEHGLEGRNCWDIHVKDEYMKVLSYSIDFKRDNRYKYKVKGKVNTIKFSPAIEMGEDATVDDLIRELKIEMAKNNLKRLKEDRADLERQIKEHDDCIAKWLVDLKVLETSQ